MCRYSDKRLYYTLEKLRLTSYMYIGVLFILKEENILNTKLLMFDMQKMKVVFGIEGVLNHCSLQLLSVAVTVRMRLHLSCV